MIWPLHFTKNLCNQFTHCMEIANDSCGQTNTHSPQITIGGIKLASYQAANSIHQAGGS